MTETIDDTSKTIAEHRAETLLHLDERWLLAGEKLWVTLC